MTPEFANYQEAQAYVQNKLRLDLWSYARALVFDLENILADPPGGLYIANSAVPCIPKSKPLYWAPYGTNTTPTLITDWQEIITNPRADVLDINQDTVLRMRYLDMFKDYITTKPTRLTTACLLIRDTAVDYLRRTTVHPGERFHPTDISKYFKSEEIAREDLASQGFMDTEGFTKYIPEVIERIWEFVAPNRCAVYHVRKRTTLGLLEIEMGVDYRILAYYQGLENNTDE